MVRPVCLIATNQRVHLYCHGVHETQGTSKTPWIPCSENNTRIVVEELLKGFAVLYKAGIVHQDLKLLACAEYFASGT